MDTEKGKFQGKMTVLASPGLLGRITVSKKGKERKKKNINLVLSMFELRDWH